YDPKLYKPSDRFLGLFRSFFMIRITRHILLGPRAMLMVGPVKSTGQKSNTELMHFKFINGEFIAYVGTLVR
ncbi:hypothetical protein PENSPDRAFT_549496, partial [Peniophora sp. CONT]